MPINKQKSGKEVENTAQHFRSNSIIAQPKNLIIFQVVPLQSQVQRIRSLTSRRAKLIAITSKRTRKRIQRRLETNLIQTNAETKKAHNS